jgi:hypothetical protein
MAIGNYAGHARVNPRDPSAQGECDRCGRWYQLDQLSKQWQWQGISLIWEGYLVCAKCNDTPQEQNKVLILPPDPKPRVLPRPSREVTPPATTGFTPPTSFDNLGMTRWDLTTAAPIAGTYPKTKAAVLTAIQTLSGITTPTPITDQSITTIRGTSQTALLANPTRTWMLAYNPTQQTAEFALGATTWNGTSNLAIGAGEAYFWANAQNLTQVYQGIVSAIGQFSNLPLWFWDSSAGGFGNDGGVLFLPFPPLTWQVGPIGLPAGAVYLVPNVLPGNQFAVGIVPGIVPNPLAPPVLFASVTVAGLLSLGGGNLPLSNPGIGTQQLWNNGGLISIA